MFFGISDTYCFDLKHDHIFAHDIARKTLAITTSRKIPEFNVNIRIGEDI